MMDLPLESSSRNDEPTCLLKTQNYQIYALIERVAPVMRTVVSVLDYRLGPDLIHLRFFAEKWCLSMHPTDSPIDASNRFV